MRTTKGIKPVRGNNKQVTLNLTEELVDSFRLYAERADLSFSQAIRVAMRLLLETEGSKHESNSVN